MKIWIVEVNLPFNKILYDFKLKANIFITPENESNETFGGKKLKFLKVPTNEKISYKQ